jgi:hypothetical protein
MVSGKSKSININIFQNRVRRRPTVFAAPRPNINPASPFPFQSSNQFPQSQLQTQSANQFPPSQAQSSTNQFPQSQTQSANQFPPSQSQSSNQSIRPSNQFSSLTTRPNDNSIRRNGAGRYTTYFNGNVGGKSWSYSYKI